MKNENIFTKFNIYCKLKKKMVPVNRKKGVFKLVNLIPFNYPPIHTKNRYSDEIQKMISVDNFMCKIRRYSKILQMKILNKQN